MGGYEVSVTVRGMLEDVAARVVRALRAQGLGIERAEPAGAGAYVDRYEVSGRPRTGGGRAGDLGTQAQVVLGEARGLVTVVVHEPEPVDDVVEAGAAGRAAALAPGTRVRLRAALASLEGEP